MSISGAVQQCVLVGAGPASYPGDALVLASLLLLASALVVAAIAIRVRLARRHAAAEGALRASEERLKRALDASGLALWDFDVDSGSIYISESWSQLLGRPQGVTRTTFAALAELVPEGERVALRRDLVAALKNPDAGYRVEHRVRKADGTWLWILSEGRVVERSPEGRAVRMIGTNRDITERKQAEAARAMLEAQLRESQKMEAIGTLAGGIAHDFNNVLGGIIGNVALAREDLVPDHPVQISLEQINKAALRARGMVQQILAYSRRQPQELSNRPLRPLVEETLRLMRSTLPAGVALQAQLGSEPLNVLADSAQMQQVLLNLCTNAWHALEGKAGRIVVGLAGVDLDAQSCKGLPGLNPGPHAHLWVSDDGCGMDVATRARIFEPFFTTKPVGQGTGLGLSVVHGIVAAHHGAIAVETQKGKGSSFHLYFPLLEPSTNAMQTSGWGGLDTLHGMGRGEHVLYVDDDEVMLLLVERMLRRLGYRVTCCQDPREALASLRRQADAFDVLVTDFNMPYCSGLDLAEEVRNIRSELPVVISSGHITQDLQARMRRSNVRGLIQKENTLEELGPLVRRVLQEA